MTRGKWVALAVGLAALAVLLPYGPALWMAAAYVEERKENVWLHDPTKDGEYEGILDPVDYLLLKRKRFDWLPGSDRMAQCSFCVETQHVKCPRVVFETWSAATPGLDRVEQSLRLDILAEHLCTCPHPSHAQESEQ